MGDSLALAMHPRPGLQLQHAARIRGNNHLRAGDIFRAMTFKDDGAQIGETPGYSGVF